MNRPLWDDEQAKPLGHLRILDLSMMLPAPYLTRVLAQYGAEVIKVEALPGGDPIRGVPGTAAGEWLNQGKKSVAVNLRTAEGRALVKQLSREVDVLVENYRDGVMESMGLGYAELSHDNPELLYLSLRGFSGARSSQPGHDINFIATSGCGDWFLEGGPNYACNWGDMVGGMLAPLIKLLAHLSNPDRRGMQLTSYMDQSFRSLFLDRAFDAMKTEPGLHRFFDGTQPHSRYYACEDGGWISINAIQDKHWERFCEGLGKPDWVGRKEDPSLVAELSAVFAGQTASYWEALFAGKEVCLFKVLTWEDHLMETSSRMQILRDPLSWAGFASNPLGPSPELGSDTFSVVRDLGLSAVDFSRYMSEGILFQPAAKE